MEVKRIDNKIRRQASRQGFIASCKTVQHHLFEGNRERLWWFGVAEVPGGHWRSTTLQSQEEGLADDEAIEWLQEEV